MNQIDFINELSKALPFEVLKIEKSDRSESAYLTFKNRGIYKRIRLASHSAVANYSKCDYEIELRIFPAGSYFNHSDQTLYNVGLEVDDNEVVSGETEANDPKEIIQLISSYIISSEESVYEA